MQKSYLYYDFIQLISVMTEYLESLLSKDYIALLSENFVYQQLIIVVSCILLAFLAKRILKSIVKKLKNHIRLAWLQAAITIFAAASKPFFAFIFSNFANLILESLELPSHLMDWFSELLLLWFFFRVVQKTIEHNFPEDRALFWSRKILAPIILLSVVLASFGVLDTIINWKLSFQNLDFNISLKSIFVGLIILLVFSNLGKWLKRILRVSILPQVGADKAVAHAVSTLSFYFIAVLGVLLSLTAIGIDLSSLTVVAGGLSVGIGFGLQAIVSNFVAGFILLFEKSVSPGDVIEIAGQPGQVKAIGIRSITLLTRDNIEMIIPNSHYLTEIVTNLTRSSNLVRLRVGVGVSYDADPREVERVLLEVCEHKSLLAKPEPIVIFTEFGDSSLNFELLVWTKNAEIIAQIASDLRFSIFEKLKEHNIEIPFPQRDIHIRSDVNKK